jgi:predicted outer membrane repeat protein
MDQVAGSALVMALALFALGGPAAFAQEAARSVYVSAQGGDENDGRSEAGAYKTLGKAFHTAAQGVVKTITVIGSVGGCSVKDVGEITLIGKDGGAGVNGAVTLSGNSTVRIERLSMAGGVSITGGAVVTLGKDAKVSGKGVTVEGDSGLTLEKNAEISNCGGNGIYFTGGLIILKDNAGISNCGGGVSGSGALTMRDDAKIVRNIKKSSWNSVSSGGGVEFKDGEFTMSGGAVIEGNSAGVGGGVYIEGGNFVMRDNAAVIGNAADNNGGGVYIEGGSFVMRDNAAVVGNAAVNGGGGGIAIYYTIKFNSFTMRDDAVVARNEAGEVGGGIFIGCGGRDYEKTFNGAGDCTLQGGAVVSENKSKFGGGIYYAGAAFYYEGFGFATVGRSASSSFGGVVMRDNVLIKNNSASEEGGGVYANGGRIQEIITVSSSHKIGIEYRRYGFVMEGGSIEGNAAGFGAGVYAYAITRKERLPAGYSGKETEKTITAAGFTFSGGKISGNQATFVGGGVYQKTKEAFVQNGDGIIAGNGAGDGAGEDVFIPQ